MHFISTFKKVLAKILKKINYKIKNIKPNVKNNSYDNIIKFLLGDKPFDVKNLDKTIPPVGKKIIVFDVGANFGQSISRFSLIFKNSEIYSFEPNKNNFKILKEKFSQKKNINICQLALSDIQQEKEFFMYPYGSSSFLKMDVNSTAFKRRQMSFLNEEKNKSFETIDKVQTMTLDKFCEKNSIKNIDVLKIDTQGHESEVLNGSLNMLSKQNIKIVQYEDMNNFLYLHTDERKKKASKILTDNDYHLIAADRAGNLVADTDFQCEYLYVCAELKNKIKKFHQRDNNFILYRQE